MRTTHYCDILTLMREGHAGTDPGLRERKKAETRSALSWAAIRLTVKHGLENVLVEDIAAAAGVSPRTFNNYFSSKAEAIAARHVDRLRGISMALGKRATEEPLWEAISAVVIAQFCREDGQDGPPDPRWAAGVKLMIREPAVQAELLKGSREAERELAVAIAKRIGADADNLYPQLAAAATGSAIQVSVEWWLRADPPIAITELMRNALRQIASLSDVPAQISRANKRLKEQKRS